MTQDTKAKPSNKAPQPAELNKNDLEKVSGGTQVVPPTILGDDGQSGPDLLDRPAQLKFKGKRPPTWGSDVP
jgi:hypothetical protein